MHLAHLGLSFLLDFGESDSGIYIIPQSDSEFNKTTFYLKETMLLTLIVMTIVLLSVNKKADRPIG